MQGWWWPNFQGGTFVHVVQVPLCQADIICTHSQAQGTPHSRVSGSDLQDVLLIQPFIFDNLFQRQVESCNDDFVSDHSLEILPILNNNTFLFLIVHSDKTTRFFQHLKVPSRASTLHPVLWTLLVPKGLLLCSTFHQTRIYYLSHKILIWASNHCHWKTSCQQCEKQACRC